MRQLVIVMLLSAAPLTASAASPEPQRQAARPLKKKLSYEGDVVRTDLLGPAGSVLEGVPRRARGSLIEVRSDFVPELMRRADDLR